MGCVASQITVPRNSVHPTPSANRRSRRVVELRAHAREEERDREEDDAEDVVRRALDVPADLRRRNLGIRIELLGLCLRREPVLRHDERRRRRVRVRQRLRREPGCERRLELRAEASLVELLELGLVLRVRVDPLDEGRDVDLLLGLGETLRSRGVDSDRVGAARRLRLLAVPARRLVPAPGRGDGGE